MPQSEGPPEPWSAFFKELDQLLDESLELHCIGGFTIIHAYGVARPTNDIDFIRLIPHPMFSKLCELGGQASGLHKKHKLYLEKMYSSPRQPATWIETFLPALPPRT